MSPEQARGKPIDKRTDLWAFGCCLYEALTGRKVFSEETVTDTVSAVVRAEPDWSKVSDIPARIQTLLRRCLRKNAEKRLRDIGDARLEIEDVLDEPIPESVAASSGVPAAGRWVFAIGLIFAALSVTLFFARRSEIPERRPVRRFTSVELVHQNQPGSTLALSRDGSTMVRVAFGRGQDTGDDAALYVRRLDEAEAYRLDGTERAESPFFSPDGQWVGYAADNRLYKVPIRGARPILLCVLEDFYHGGHWSIDGNIYLGAGARLIKVSAEGGEPITLAESDAPSRVGFGISGWEGSVSPSDGSGLGYWCCTPRR
jgi:serine/threonine-protein kinase